MQPAEFLFPVLTLALAAAVLAAANRLLERRYRDRPQKAIHKQLVMAALALLTIPVVVLSLPLSESLRGQILGLIGILLSGALALSSTTFLGNALAGIMLRTVRSFRSGDFIHVGDHFGRVSGRGLFHVEIQNEDRDLTTLPNLFLATHPVKVTRASGTIVAAEVSLGYDVPRGRIEALLLEAAGNAGLQEPFVYVVQLGDFSVNYRVSGLLAEVEKLLSARSRLNASVIDALHGGGVEIVSPAFMNTRAVGEAVFIPRSVERGPEEAAPEALVFDKAQEAQALEEQQGRLQKIETELQALLDMEEGKERVKGKVAELEKARDLLRARIERRAEALEEKEPS